MRDAHPLGVPLLRIPFVLLLVTIVVACGSAASSPSSTSSPGPPAQLAIDRAASGTTVTLAPGQPLVIALDTNPSTGYGWEVDVAPDPAVLTLVGEPAYVPASGGDQRVGAGGQSVLTFRAVAPGETSLALVYRRAWEAMVEPEDRFELAVVVR